LTSGHVGKVTLLYGQKDFVKWKKGGGGKEESEVRHETISGKMQ